MYDSITCFHGNYRFVIPINSTEWITSKQQSQQKNTVSKSIIEVTKIPTQFFKINAPLILNSF